MEISAMAAASGRAQIAQNFLIFLCILPLCNLHKKTAPREAGRAVPLHQVVHPTCLPFPLGRLMVESGEN
jgi:hypothetical protein